MLKEQAGMDRLQVELPPGATVADAVAEAGSAAGIVQLVERMPLAHAVNREYVKPEAALADGDELALIPPVSGGAPDENDPRIHAAITGDALSADDLIERVRDPRAGAIVTFHGVTREVDRLEYEAFDEMALELLERILRRIAGEHDVIALAATHRVGEVPLSEPSVIVAASSAHREAAFVAARAAIDQIKLELPVWKKEVTGSGETQSKQWVAGTPVIGGGA
jgi:molybdopterin synthase catalytic subunit